ERSFALGWASHLAGKQGDFLAASTLNAEALLVARQLDDPFGIAQALYQEGCIANRLGDLPRAQALLGQALTLRRVSGPPASELYDLLELGATAEEQSDHA